MKVKEVIEKIDTFKDEERVILKETPVEYHSKSEMRRVEHMKKGERPKIISNKIRCLKCGDIIESKHRHDFVSCSCGAVSVDGGKDYLKRCGSEKSVI